MIKKLILSSSLVVLSLAFGRAHAGITKLGHGVSAVVMGPGYFPGSELGQLGFDPQQIYGFSRSFNPGQGSVALVNNDQMLVLAASNRPVTVFSASQPGHGRIVDLTKSVGQLQNHVVGQALSGSSLHQAQEFLGLVFDGYRAEHPQEIDIRYLGPKDLRQTALDQFTIGAAAQFRRIPAGLFIMRDDAVNYPYSQAHQVVLTHPIMVQEKPTTKKMFAEVMGEKLSDGDDPDALVHSVSWYQAIEFVNKLSILAGFDPAYRMVRAANKIYVTPTARDIYDTRGYRLPTEAEMEYFMRAGSAQTRPASEEHVNPWGIALKNIFTWASDASEPYPPAIAINPVQTQRSRRLPDSRAIRGGNLISEGFGRRHSHLAVNGSPNLGIRVVRTLP